MRLTRYVGFIDLGIAAVILVMIVLPPREMYAAAAHKGTESEQFALALAEAKTVARPKDTSAVSELSRRLATDGFRDWAVESALRAQDQTSTQADHWRTLLATSVAYIDRFDIEPALDYANRAVAWCKDPQKQCPSFELIRMQAYRAHLEGSAKSGINPWRDPDGFNRAGENALLNARILSNGR